MAWQIDHDFIAPEDEQSAEGHAEEYGRIPVIAAAIGLESPPLPVTGEKFVRFRLYDDDDELYYEGSCHDDDECLNQSAALTWGEGHAGCTKIKVLRNSQWVFEIG